MKAKIFLSLLGFLLLINATQAQSLKMNQLEGVWKYTPGNMGANSDEDFEAYAIQRNHKRLFITFWKSPKTATSNVEYWGLFNGEKEDFKKISDLKNSGDQFFSIDQKCVDAKTNEFICAGRSTKVGYEVVKTIENDATKFYLHWHQKPDDYTKVNTIPDELLNRIKADEGLWKQYASFEKVAKEKSFRTINVSKSIIYKAHNQATKMYFVKGDKIEVLEELPGWVKFKFFNKRVIEGWVKTADTE